MAYSTDTESSMGLMMGWAQRRDRSTDHTRGGEENAIPHSRNCSAGSLKSVMQNRDFLILHAFCNVDKIFHLDLYPVHCGQLLNQVSPYAIYYA